MTEYFDEKTSNSELGRQEYRQRQDMENTASQVIYTPFDDVPKNNSTEDEETSSPVSVLNWFFSLFVCVIPIVNIVTLLIWAFLPDTNPTKKSFAKAKLIWVVIELIVFIIAAYFGVNYLKELVVL